MVMKIQCSVCEAAEANVLCCADEAALCWGCDQKVHAANKLASKHHRVLLSSSQTPQCDICQEIVGYFFCLQDRALLCLKCDAAIHSANALVFLHQRFLVTGVKVGPEATESQPSSSLSKTRSVPKAAMSSSILSRHSFDAGNITQWPFDESLKIGDFNQNASFVNIGLSEYQANSLELGDSNLFRPVEGLLETNECPDQMPDTFWAVPQITSQLRDSELHLSRSYQNPSTCATFVPDVSSPRFQISRPHQEPRGTSSKRRRQF